MKKLFLATLLLLVAFASHAAQKAVTDTGEQVILNGDGTWIYADKAQKTDQEIEVNNAKFEKPQASTFLLKSKRNKSSFWIDSSKWSFKKPDHDAVIEYQFQLKGKDLYAMAITEGVEIPVDSLADIALTNAQGAAPDAKVVKKEYRTVNGKKVIYMEMKGTIKGINFTYLGYYYASSAGATQFIAYTATSAVTRYSSEIIELLNGLDVQ